MLQVPSISLLSHVSLFTYFLNLCAHTQCCNRKKTKGSICQSIASWRLIAFQLICLIRVQKSTMSHINLLWDIILEEELFSQEKDVNILTIRKTNQRLTDCNFGNNYLSTVKLLVVTFLLTITLDTSTGTGYASTDQ